MHTYKEMTVSQNRSTEITDGILENKEVSPSLETKYSGLIKN
jgi:hypothetical protein